MAELFCAEDLLDAEFLQPRLASIDYSAKKNYQQQSRPFELLDKARSLHNNAVQQQDLSQFEHFSNDLMSLSAHFTDSMQSYSEDSLDFLHHRNPSLFDAAIITAKEMGNMLADPVSTVQSLITQSNYYPQNFPKAQIKNNPAIEAMEQIGPNNLFPEAHFQVNSVDPSPEAPGRYIAFSQYEYAASSSLCTYLVIKLLCVGCYTQPANYPTVVQTQTVPGTAKPGSDYTSNLEKQQFTFPFDRSSNDSALNIYIQIFCSNPVDKQFQLQIYNAKDSSGSPVPLQQYQPFSNGHNSYSYSTGSSINATVLLTAKYSALSFASTTNIYTDLDSSATVTVRCANCNDSDVEFSLIDVPGSARYGVEYKLPQPNKFFFWRNTTYNEDKGVLSQQITIPLIPHESFPYARIFSLQFKDYSAQKPLENSDIMVPSALILQNWFAQITIVPTLYCGGGKRVEFIRNNTDTHQTESEFLCLCPFDRYGSHCESVQLANCAISWLNPNPRDHCGTDSGDLYEKFGYSSGLHGFPPCLLLPPGQSNRFIEIKLAADCRFVNASVREEFGDAQKYAQLVAQGFSRVHSADFNTEFLYDAIRYEENSVIYAVTHSNSAMQQMELRVVNLNRLSDLSQTKIALLNNASFSDPYNHPAIFTVAFASLHSSFLSAGRYYVESQYKPAIATQQRPARVSSDNDYWRYINKAWLESSDFSAPPYQSPPVLSKLGATILAVVIILAALIGLFSYYRRWQTAKLQQLFKQMREKDLLNSALRESNATTRSERKE
jgi:hypothetical protein